MIGVSEEDTVEVETVATGGGNEISAEVEDTEDVILITLFADVLALGECASSCCVE